MNLFDILACPACKVAVKYGDDHLLCPQCACRYPIVKGVPIMLPGGAYSEIEHQYHLNVETTYAPWVHRMILQSLTDQQVVLDAGSGNMQLDDPCIIRMDIKYTPYVDLVGDLHALPFLPESLDYIFALAVFEHLRQPFVAADEIYRTLKPGGLVYAEANFVYPYHGYPYHYFNISIQGFQEIFARFKELKTGVAPYQMPGFAMDFVLATYLDIFRPKTPQEHELVQGLQRALQHPLHDYDRKIVPSEAYRGAAGDFYIGAKQPQGNERPIPEPVWQVYQADTELQARFPNPLHLFEPDNLMYWARTEGRQHHPTLRAYFDQPPHFIKYAQAGRAFDRAAIHSLAPIPPPGTPWFTDNRQLAEAGPTGAGWRYLLAKTWYHLGRGEFRTIWLKVQDFWRKRFGWGGNR